MVETQFQEIPVLGNWIYPKSRPLAVTSITWGRGVGATRGDAQGAECLAGAVNELSVTSEKWQ